MMERHEGGRAVAVSSFSGSFLRAGGAKRGRFAARGIRNAGFRWATALCLLLLWAPGEAQEGAQDRAQEKPQAVPGADVQIQLRSIEKDIERSNFEQRRLAFEIENVTAEAQKLRAELIAVAARVRAAEERVAEGETRVEELRRQEDALRRSLQGRERVTAEILAAMQRIGRKPPPALLVRPEDVLQAMRAAILLGAVLPDMRDEAMILVADLKTLVELRRQAAAAAEALRGARDGIASEHNRLAELVAQRQDRLKMSQEELDRERMRVATLAREARSLRDLISRSENEIVGQPRAAEIARRAPAPARGTEVASLGTGAGREPARLQPRQSLAERRGQVPLPVSGTILRRFGQPDGLGGTERGITISSNANAVVTMPADGWVHFAGPYRGYGHLLIINAGNGYHIVLAGLDRLSVEIGQFVLAGEPVGFLGRGGEDQGGEARQGLGTPRPALYVEFRKDGSPVDPSPWWSTQSAEKARG